ncbi:MAG: AI-2E family transporter [Candidatus Dojkabacteria bacterium]
MFSKKKFTVKIEFPNKQILKLLVVVLLVFLLIYLKTEVLILLLAFIFMAAFKPAAEFLEQHVKIPRAISLFTVYLVVLTILGASVYFVGKPLSSEINNFVENTPRIVNNFVASVPFFNDRFNEEEISTAINESINGLFDNFRSTFDAIINFTFGAFNIAVNIITIFIISIYLYLEREKVINYITRLFNLDKKHFMYTYEKVEVQLGAWVRGQLLLGLIIGFSTWILLSLFGFKFAVPLAFLAGLLELIPIIGPIITGILITIVGLSTSPILGIIGLLISVLLQQLENSLLVPNIMKKAVGLSPVVTLLSILIGAKLLGLLGAVIAIPCAATVSVLLDVYMQHRLNHNQEMN